MERKLYSLRGGLKNARRRKGFTQADLADKLGFNLKTIMNWEQGLSNPDLETMMVLAKLLECDLDYLTGRLQESSHDIHFVCEFTGMSENAIEKICSSSADKSIGKPLSHMIESREFDKLISSYGIYLEMVSKLSIEDLDGSSFELSEDGTVNLSRNEAIHHFNQRVAKAMSLVCDDEYFGKISRLERKKQAISNNESRSSILHQIQSIEAEIMELTEQKQFLEEEVLPVVSSRNKAEKADEK